jgi:MFS family permease
MGRFTVFRAAAATAALFACGAALGDSVDLRIRRDTGRARAIIVARDVAVGGIAGAVVSGGVLAYTASVAGGAAQDWRPVLATGVGVGLILGLAVGMIQANRYGRDEPARPTSDGLSFQEQHPRDRSGAFVAGLPALRF